MASNFSCRCCKSNNAETILSLGELPLANALVSEQNLSKVEKKYPLKLVFCSNCSLLQIAKIVDPNILFGEYLYFSSYSDTMLRHSEALVNYLIERQRLSKDNLVIEIASNDGYLLQYFQGRGIPVLGIEPARNIAKVAQEKGIPTLCKFFNKEIATELKKEDKLADVIIGNNVLAHVADLNNFVEGVHILLKDKGVAIFEFPYVRDMIEKNEFDTIYHEHLYYYSLTSVKNLFNRYNLIIVDVERTPIHGGSLRIYVQHNSPNKVPKESVNSLFVEEHNLGMNELIFYRSFANKVLMLKDEMLKLLKKLKNKGKKIVAYGAAAKGSTLLNYFGIGKDYIEYIVDRNPHKQGRYMSGIHIPIEVPDKIRETKPDYVLILPWNIKDEIMEQMSFIREWEGKFIVPISEMTVL